MKSTKTTSFKIIKTFFSVLIFTMACQQSFGQMGNGIVFQQMRILGESNTHIDVSGAIVKCDSINQVHLKVFNETNTTQDAAFKLVMTNSENGESFSKEISIQAMTPLQILEGSCSANQQSADLIINLPATYNPNKIAMNITF